VLWGGLRLAGAGVVVGFIGAFAATQWEQSQLYDVSRLDPSAFGLAAVVLLALALLAAWVPARRASVVDPIVTLRN
jgi:putative ABC transport system permease protein